MSSFAMIWERDVREIRGMVRLWRHTTGAEVLSVACDDDNKVFGIAFRTPPPDSTGVAHILEHSVLCGSRKYPIKEPFVELLKGSLQTFLNAFTYPDKTCYPVASTNTRDFYNLVDVYLDAVFYPRIEEHILGQEGWHLEPDESGQGWLFKGVVYNEMKGAYSSPGGVLAEYVQQSLFPDTVYGLDSGGDPKNIPDLTYEAFKGFHASYYHPSNARVYFYGDDPEEERLQLLGEYLDKFEARETDSDIALQSAFGEPRRVEKAYAMETREEDESNRAMCTVNWLLPPLVDESGQSDAGLILLLQMLDYILVGMSASPLRKALIDSGLGEDTAGVGLESELRQMYFSTGLKGMAEENADAVEQLILDTLSRLAEQGVQREMVEAAMNTVEFELRENNTGRYPRGLHIMLRSLTTWLYGGDPLALVEYESLLASMKQRLESGEPVFEDAIKRYFLDNPHRTTLVLRPDPELSAKREAEEKERVDAIIQGLDKAVLERLREEARLLETLQRTPDSEEALATIPRLDIADLDPENKLIPKQETRQADTDVLTHDLGTDSIVYLDLAFDLTVLPWELIPLVPLFGRAMQDMGTDTESFTDLAMRVARKTGGVDSATLSATHQEDKSLVARLILRGKATLEKADDMLDIMAAMLLRANFSDRDRFRQILLEEKAGMEHRIVPSGHMAVAARLGARFSRSGRLDEAMGGVSQLTFQRQLLERMDADWEGVRADLMRIRDLLVTRSGLLANVTLDGASLPGFESKLEAFLQQLPDTANPKPDWPDTRPSALEGLSIPAQVNYVGKCLDLAAVGYEYHGSAGVITRYLRTSWLWDQVRVQGGAYGSFCMLDRINGSLSFVSYRDPNILSTLQAYDNAAEFLSTLNLTDDERIKSVIGAIGTLDSPLLPDAKGYASMVRHLAGDTDERRQEMRDQVLSTTAAHFRAFGETLREAAPTACVTVLGEESALRRAASEMAANGWDFIRVL